MPAAVIARQPNQHARPRSGLENFVVADAV